MTAVREDRGGRQEAADGTAALSGLRVPPELLAAAPAARRDGVRLLVGRRSTGEVTDHAFRDLPGLLRAGDVLVVNTSRTLPAAVDGRLGGAAGGTHGGSRGTDGAERVVVHFSTRRDDGSWVVELRTPDGRGSTVRRRGGPAGAAVELPGGAGLVLREPLDERGDRLWVARVSVPRPGRQARVRRAGRVPEGPEAADLGDAPGAPDAADVVAYLERHGRPIRYSYTSGDQPLAAYQTVFATPSGDGLGSAEMPSAGRPFTAALVTELVSRGVQVAPVVLHTGVASAEAHEPPYAERFRVPASTAWQVNAARAAGGRVVAVGTTAVRALETAADERGTVRPAEGWTELVVTPRRGVRAVDGLLTGLHEPEASHLLMLRALSGDRLLARVYRQALAHGYLWHEFGDVNLLLP